jgi:ATP-dependent Zn protease
MKTKKIIYILFLIATIICATSCGVRKTQQTKTDVTTKEVVTDNSTIETKTNTNTKVIDCTFTDEIEIIPIDNTKEIIVNNKSYKNVRIKYKKTKSNTTTQESIKESKTQKNNIKNKIKTELKNKNKTTESKRNIFLDFWWLWLLIIALIYLGYKNRKILFLK